MSFCWEWNESILLKYKFSIITNGWKDHVQVYTKVFCMYILYSAAKLDQKVKKKTQRQTGKNESCKVGFGVSKQYNSTYVLKQSLFYTKYFSGCIRGEIG